MMAAHFLKLKHLQCLRQTKQQHVFKQISSVVADRAPLISVLSKPQFVSMTTSSQTKEKENPDSAAVRKTDYKAEVTQVEQEPDEIDLYREKYIPITRRTLIRRIIEEKNLLTAQEQRKFDEFAIALDSAIVQEYHGVLNELKTLFDPVNPDKDTMPSQRFTRTERLDNEFWLLQKLEDVMEKANFHKLSDDTVTKALQEHTNQGIRVKVDKDQYNKLSMWILGKEVVPVSVPWYKSLFSKKSEPKKPKPEYLKRVVVICRLKGDHKIMLKCFKEVPATSLEMLLPSGRTRMSVGDKLLLAGSTAVGLFTVVGEVTLFLAYSKLYFMNLVLPTVLASLLTGTMVLFNYTTKSKKYLEDLHRISYFKTVANNRGFLALMVDRAQDETFKEALIVYLCILSHRPPGARQEDTGYYQMVIAELGGTTEEVINKWAEDWVVKVTGIPVEFDSSEAVQLLRNLGILKEHKDRLSVLPLEAAIKNLPRQPFSVIVRANEVSLNEGMDRDEFLESERQYKRDDVKSMKYGWFSRFL
ncbi:transmembrane protein 143-like [Ostrea edulis]|uniref:transmembrane protein 143-like n=1 Tax=Ostrea edulis TaxID=37623 RepID=UPI0020941E6A|nr:transmembrane protein 143-like [Ostrea edulis]